MVQLYLIRHGESTANSEKRHASAMPYPLTPLGEREALQEKAFYQSIGFQKLYSSDIVRAEQTLKLIFGEKAEYEVSTNLRELDTGILTGQKVEDCKKIYGDDYLAARACWGFDRYGGDSAASITQRALRFLREVEQLPRDIERVAAFTHSGIIRALAANILQIPLSPVTPVKISNCCCAVLTFDGDRWRISKWNVCSATEGKLS